MFNNEGGSLKKSRLLRGFWIVVDFLLIVAMIVGVIALLKLSD